MAKLNTVELMSEFNSLNMNVKDFCDMKKISTSTFYNHKHIYESNDFLDIESNDFLDITNLTKTTYDNTITINIGVAVINVTNNTDLNLLKKLLTALTL